jgi:trans-aconitate 2-methyltransferase
MAWDPTQYDKFKKERSRPFFDLLAQLDDISPRTIVDLGCGTGELTAELAKKWQHAQVVGVDSSPEMLEKSRAYAGERLRFMTAAMEQWTPSRPIDLILSNSAFHWLNPHEKQIQRIASFVAAGGAFAFQAPNQFKEPTHVIMQEVRNAPEWRPLVGSETPDSYLAEPMWYIEALSAMGFQASVFETMYYQVVQGDDPVLEWLKGTSLRCILDKLDPGKQERFALECGEKLRAAYPKKESGTLFPYRRMFVIAKRGN